MIEMRADEIIPGDVIDIRCASYDYREVLSVRVLANDAPGAQDRIEIRFAGEGLSNTRTLLASSAVRVQA